MGIPCTTGCAGEDNVTVEDSSGVLRFNVDPTTACLAHIVTHYTSLMVSTFQDRGSQSSGVAPLP